MASTRLLTADEFLDLDEPEFCELVRGKVVELSRPGLEHGLLMARLAWLLMTHVQRHGLGYVTAGDAAHRIASEPDTVRGPDVGFLRKAKVPAEGFPRLWPSSPDLVVEVISPNDRWSYVEEKTRDWLRGGAEEVWLIDPRQQEVRVIGPDGAPRILHPGDVLRSDVVAGFAVPVAEIFAV